MADPVAWKVVEAGWDVLDSDGEGVGTVAEVLGDPEADIFDGLSVSRGLLGGDVYVPSEQVGAIEQGTVHLMLDAAALERREVTDELAFAPALELAARVRAREVSPLELVDLYLERIERLDPQLNAYVTVDADGARAAARAAESAADAPFRGVPLPIKDLHETAGLRTTYSTKAYADNVPAARPGRRAAPARGGLHRPRQDEHARAGDDRADGVGAERRLPQSLGHRADAGRVERRRGRGGRGRARAGGARQRRRRLDPHPCLLLRPRRDQAVARPRLPRTRTAPGRSASAPPARSPAPSATPRRCSTS